METFEVAQLFIAFGTLIAAGTIVNYSRKRSARADLETRKAFRPLYLFALALIVYAAGAFLTYYEALTETSVLVDLFGAQELFEGLSFPYYTLYLVLIIEIVILAIASSMITRQYYMAIFIVLASVVSIYLLSNSIQLLLEFRVSSQADFLFNLGSIIRSIMLLAVTVVFMWIASDTRRGTTAAMAYALLMQILNLPDLYGGFVESPVGFAGINLPLVAIYIIIFFALMGPAMVAFTFLRPDQEMTGELIGYGASFAGPALVISALIAQELASDYLVALMVSLASLTVMLAMGTTAYLYGRYRESKALPTFLLMSAFAFFAIGQISGLLGNMGIFPLMDAIYVEFIFGGLALSILSITAFYAAGYRSVGLIPLLAFLPVIILFIQAFPTPLETVFNDIVWLIVPNLILFFLPAILFIRVGLQMRTAGAPGRLRPLGIGVGILLFLAIRIPFMLLNLPGVDPGYALISMSFLVSWLALTGRLDKWAGTA
ncbi:MAG: hypothetical protein ACFE7R_09920 [Candidatus Hodarchaeota archaeon]